MKIENLLFYFKLSSAMILQNMVGLGYADTKIEPGKNIYL